MASPGVPGYREWRLGVTGPVTPTGLRFSIPGWPLGSTRRLAAGYPPVSPLADAPWRGHDCRA
jgi:hypothetical protein